MKTYNFFVTVLFIIFMRKALTEDFFFWGGGGDTRKYELCVSFKGTLSVLVN